MKQQQQKKKKKKKKKKDFLNEGDLDTTCSNFTSSLIKQSHN